MTTKKSNLVRYPDYSTQQNHADGSSSTRRYHAYLLRFWQEEEGSAWRIQVEHVQTREVIGFSSLEKLMQFLDSQLLAGERTTI